MGRGAEAGSIKIGWPSENPITAQPVDESAVTDIQFELQGTRLPVDHGFLLFQALAGVLDWLATEERVGIQPIHGAETGTGELILNRRAKLVMRTPIERLEALQALTGQTIDVGGHALHVGESKLRPLPKHTPLFAHCVVTGSDDETVFTTDIIRILDEMNITCRFVCGRKQTVNTAEGPVSGYSLMLHGLPIEHSILVQQRGIGGHRRLGCGIFIPHKSTDALI
jgi:CRISPR-associated protein Cas6